MRTRVAPLWCYEASHNEMVGVWEGGAYHILNWSTWSVLKRSIGTPLEWNYKIIIYSGNVLRQTTRDPQISSCY